MNKTQLILSMIEDSCIIILAFALVALAWRWYWINYYSPQVPEEKEK